MIEYYVNLFYCCEYFLYTSRMLHNLQFEVNNIFETENYGTEIYNNKFNTRNRYKLIWENVI